MGIDLKKGGRMKSRRNKKMRSPNLYLKLLIKLFKFLARRTNKKIHATILHRLMLTRINRPTISLSRIAKHVKNSPQKTAIAISKVTND